MFKAAAVADKCCGRGGRRVEGCLTQVSCVSAEDSRTCVCGFQCRGKL